MGLRQFGQDWHGHYSCFFVQHYAVNAADAGGCQKRYHRLRPIGGGSRDKAKNDT